MIDLGDVHTITAEVRDTDGTLVDPATADLTITLPDGTTDTPVVSLPPAETGKLRVEYPTVQAGLHRWRLTTTGPVTAAADVFNVAPADLHAVVSLDSVKDHLNISAADTSYDDELRGFIASATAVVEDIVGSVVRRTIVETASGGSGYLRLSHYPVLDVTSIEVDGTVVDAGDYTWSPSGLVANRVQSWPAGLHNVTVTYVVGREVAPANVLDATRELIRINFRPQQGGNYSPYDLGSSDDFGVSRSTEGSLQGEIRLGFFIPNTVTQRLQPQRRAPVVL